MSYKTSNKSFLIPLFSKHVVQDIYYCRDSQQQTGEARFCSLHRLILLYLLQNKTKYSSLVLT